MKKAGNEDGRQRTTSGRLARSGNASSRVVAVIDALARCSPDGIGVRELAASLAVSRSATHRILQQLTELHVARALPSGSYAPGALLIAWTAFLAQRHSLLTAAEEVLTQLVDTTGETAYLFSYRPNDDFATTVTAQHCDKPVRYMLEPGSSAPLHIGAAGKAILAFAPGELIDAVTTNAGVSKTTLRRELADIRRRGYVATVGERISEACGVAAPYFSDGDVAGSITVTIPRYRFDPDSVPTLGVAVATAAEHLTRTLSATGASSVPTS